MQSFSAIGVFCEDIREEQSGQHTLVGIFSDNVNIPELPLFMPKLAIYIRINLDPAISTRTITTKLKVPGGPELPMANLSNLIDKSTSQARENGMPYAGLLAKTVFSPFPVQAAGKIEAIVQIEGVEYICGALNVIVSAPVAAPEPSAPAPAAT
jgi:hypothetical protein